MTTFTIEISRGELKTERYRIFRKCSTVEWCQLVTTVFPFNIVIKTEGKIFKD